MSFTEKIGNMFKSYKGLIGLLILYETALVLWLSTFSEPMIERFGNVPILEYIFPLLKGLDPARHAMRAILIYHAVAVPFLVAVVFFFMDGYQFRPKLESMTKWTLFAGAFVSSISAMIFVYIENWMWHGLFIAGLSVVFYGGVLFVIGVWPTKSFPDADGNDDAMIWNINWEYLNLAITGIAILISAAIAAIAASNFGRLDPNYPDVLEPVYNRTTGVVTYEKINYFVPRLLEVIVRRENNNAGWTFYEMLVAHLHIMVALLSGAVLLYSIRHTNMKGFWYKLNMILFTPGVIILAGGAWAVVTPLSWAHHIIDAGAGFLLIIGVITAIYAWRQIAINKLGDTYPTASGMEKVKATFSDSVRLGLYWQLIWVGLVSALPGIFVGINLERFRDGQEALAAAGQSYTGNEPYWAIEYSFNVGHWHVLATLTAMIVVFIAIDYYGVTGKLRNWSGWALTLGTILGFGFATKYMLRSPGASHDFDFWMIDIGLALLFFGVIVVALYVIIDFLFTKVKSTTEE